ncbi:putative RNA-directed DNA polymerase from transposon BS [Nephila pilipes]|uniref:Putative RNA-directed DNA polymerase from transposon BS n=1 Tax=Nephila pilipes TaxID=299642 RepID=A0A8X6MP64_NEPPI|nr:putative RNA-directed DNA polymerase from transposon BS [Nephila pilipes]
MTSRVLGYHCVRRDVDVASPSSGGDFNGHSPQWGYDGTNSRGRQIERLISDHSLCLLNTDEKTYFHAPTRTFHSLDLAICSPTLLPSLNLDVLNYLQNNDHFPLLISQVLGSGVRLRPPTYRFYPADWDLFTRLAVITGTMVQDRDVDDSVRNLTASIVNTADVAILKSRNSQGRMSKPWWNKDCQSSYREQKKLLGIFRRYPTTENLIAFKRAKAFARRVRRHSQR